MSGLVAKWVSVNVPGLGEVISCFFYVYLVYIFEFEFDPSSVPCLDLPWNFLAARPHEYDGMLAYQPFGVSFSAVI